MQLNRKIINNPIEKCAEEINRCFQRRHTNDQQVPGKMFTITRHQGSEIKTTMRYNATVIRMSVVKKKCWQGCQEKLTLFHCWQKCVQNFLKNIENRPTILSNNPTSNSKKIEYQEIYAFPFLLQHFSTIVNNGKQPNVLSND